MSNRIYSCKFRLGVAQRIEQGESVSKLYHEFGIKRSVLYRWRDRYRKDWAAGLERRAGRPPGVPNPAKAKPGVSAEEALRQQIAALERKVDQQALQLNFFKRVNESIQTSGGAEPARLGGES